MLVTWTALELTAPSPTCPWQPAGATWWQAGQASPETRALPTFEGRWWSVIARWDDADAAAVPPPAELGAAWHVVLEPVSFRGDAVLSEGATPFSALPERGKVAGAAAVVTLAGLGSDPARTGEFLERVVELGTDVATVPGHRASMLQAPESGAALTFSAWSTLRDAVTWAYHRPLHAATVARQEEHQLLDTGGFLRCAVLSSTGTLRGTDPLAGLTGTPVRAPREAA